MILNVRILKMFRSFTLSAMVQMSVEIARREIKTFLFIQKCPKREKYCPFQAIEKDIFRLFCDFKFVNVRDVNIPVYCKKIVYFQK